MRPAVHLLSILASLTNDPPAYRWERLTEHAGFPGSYNFPVFPIEGRFWALHPAGSWSSIDGKTWRREALPQSGLNDGYLDHVVFRGAVLALGAVHGNYQSFSVGTKVFETSDRRTWSVLADSTNLPQRVFYASAIFGDAIWLMGGWNGTRCLNEIWRSTDAKRWELVTDHAEWPARCGPSAVSFRDRLWLIGGSRAVDGDRLSDVWSSVNGKHWTRVTDHLTTEVPFGSEPVVFDGRLWLLGAEAGPGGFSSQMLWSEDGARWQSMAAPWPRRGGAALWVGQEGLYLAGGKYSHREADSTQFEYRDDVWVLRRQTSSR